MTRADTVRHPIVSGERWEAERIKLLAREKELMRLKDQVAGGVTKRTPDGRTPTQQLNEIRERVGKLLTRQEQVFLDQIVPALADAGVRFSRWDELDQDDLQYLGAQFGCQFKVIN